MKYRTHMKMVRLQAFLTALILVLSLTASQITTYAAPCEVPQAAIGIDVSRYQGKIDWDTVASSGIQFVMVRVGYRTQGGGILCEDPYARYNLQEAQRVGLKVGAYFFSSAITEAEVIEEANFTANLIDKYRITYPVAYDCEGFRSKSSRQYGMDQSVRTALAVKFLDTITARGYTPMFYAGRNEMTDNRDWDMGILNRYKVWVAQYPTDPFPITPVSTYAGAQAMWQYTNKASLPGITGTVDMNVAYFNYDGIADPKDESGVIQVKDEAAENVQYLDVYEVVTPNTKVNLRVVPSTESPDTILVPINPGDMVYRTGIGNNGWSKVLLNGQTLYAYSAYLTRVQ